jgi:hypothetical protein
MHYNRSLLCEQAVWNNITFSLFGEGKMTRRPRYNREAKVSRFQTSAISKREKTFSKGNLEI